MVIRRVGQIRNFDSKRVWRHASKAAVSAVILPLLAACGPQPGSPTEVPPQATQGAVSPTGSPSVVTVRSLDFKLLTAGSTSLESALERLPRKERYRSYVSIIDYTRVREILDLDPPPADATDDDVIGVHANPVWRRLARQASGRRQGERHATVVPKTAPRARCRSAMACRLRSAQR